MATIQGIYIALFGRPADPLGLAFFNQVTNDGADLSRIDDLTGTEEYQARFAGMSHTQIITTIYQSLFARAPDPAGLAFFVHALENGDLSIGNIAIAILDGAQGEDLRVLDAKLRAADFFTQTLADDPDALAAYQGEFGTHAGQTYLGLISGPDELADMISDSTSITELLILGGTVEIDTPPPPKPKPPVTDFTLTTEVETVTGTNRDDIFRAVVSDDDVNSPTLNANDKIDGRGGRDTLILTVGSDHGGGLPADVTLKNVEIVRIEGNMPLSDPIDAGDAFFADVEEIWQIDNFTEVSNVKSGQTIGFEDGAHMSTVSISGSAGLVVDTTGAATIETINLNLSSDGTVTLNTADGAIKTIDASASSGNLTLDASALTGLTTLEGGSGDDTLTVDIAHGTAAKALMLTGGDGADIFELNGASGNLFAVTDNDALVHSLVTIDDFGTGADTLDLSGVTAITAGRTDQTTVDGQLTGSLTDLHDAVTAVASVTDDGAFSVFAYGGHTYIYADSAAGNDLDAGDTLIQLTGSHDLIEGTNFTFAAI